MNKIFKNITLAFAAVIAMAAITACSGQDDLVEEVSYDRPFTPTGLETRVQNTTNVRLAWNCLSENEDGVTYLIEIYADDPDMNFTGTPLKYTATSSPFTVYSLEGETVYSVRVKAVRKDGTESAWAKGTFETGTEQIFLTPEPSQIGKTWITLSWLPAGTKVTRVEVVKSGETLQTINLTDEQIEAGECMVENLDPERTYTFYLYNGDKQRGKIQVTTLPNYTPVTDCKELLDAIAAAEENEVIMLTENKVYDFTEYTSSEGNTTSAIKINKSVILKTNNNATIKGIYFQINGGASLEFANITLDGEGGTGDQAFAFKEDGDYERLYVHDCEIMNYTKGFFYINVVALVNEITVNNCIIHNIECSGGDFFDCRSGGYNVFKVTNNTIYECAASRDFIRMDDASANVSATPVITVDHNTLYNVGSGGANYRLLYVRFPGNTISWTNNIVAGTNHKRGFANQAATSVPTFSNNFYYNTTNLVSKGETGDEKITFFDEDGKVLTTDPFKDAANHDFTIIDENVYNVGDPRWQ